MRFDENIINKLLKIQWWQYGPEIFEGLEIVNVEETVNELEKRVTGKLKKYECEKYCFIHKENRIQHLSVKGEIIEESIL